MKPRFLQVHWLRRAHSFAAAGTGLVAAGTERGHCGRGGRAGGSRAPAGRGRPAAVSPTPGPEWARPRLPGGGLAFPALQLPPACPEAAAQAPSQAAGRRCPKTQSGLGRGCAGLFGAGAKPPLPLPSGPCQGHLPRSPTPPPDRAESFRLRETERPPQLPSRACAGAQAGGVSLQVRGCPGHPRAHVDTRARRGVCVCWRPGHTRVWGFTRVRPLMDYGHRPTSASPPIRAGVKSERESGRPGVHASLGLRPCLCRHKRVCTRVRGACGHVRVHVLSGRV